MVYLRVDVVGSSGEHDTGLAVLLEELHGLLGLFKLRLCAGVLRGTLVGFAERFGELGVFAFKLGVFPA